MPSRKQSKPEVAIIGAGIGGLLLGQLMEQIDVPYHIYERATTVKPLGMLWLCVCDFTRAHVGVAEEANLQLCH